MEEASSEEGRRENGCYIYRNNNTGRLEMGSLIYGPVITGDEGTNGSIVPGSAQPHMNGFGKGSDALFTPVGFMHSHTTMEYMDESFQREVGPSPEDYKWAENNGIPVYTVDYEGTYSYGHYYAHGKEESDYMIYTAY